MIIIKLSKSEFNKLFWQDELDKVLSKGKKVRKRFLGRTLAILKKTQDISAKCKRKILVRKK